MDIVDRLRAVSAASFSEDATLVCDAAVAEILRLERVILEGGEVVRRLVEERDEARRLYDELAGLCEEGGEKLRLWS